MKLPLHQIEFGAVTGTLKVFNTALEVPGFQVTLPPAASHNCVPSNSIGGEYPKQKTKPQNPKAPKSQIFCSVRKLVGGGKRVGAEQEVWQRGAGGKCPSGPVPPPLGCPSVYVLPLL